MNNGNLPGDPSELELSGSFEEQVFSARYQRNNKRGGLKNLRCFPTCGFQHKERGFCGRPILVVVRQNGGAINPSTEKDLFVWAEFMLEAERPKYKVGDTVPHSKAMEFERNNEEPTRPWIRGSIVPDQFQKEQGNVVFELNREKRGWHYGWTSNKHTCDALHCLQCYIFTAERSKTVRGHPSVLVCRAQFRSPSFRLFCRRRRRFLIPPSAPIAPKNIRKSGAKLKTEPVGNTKAKALSVPKASQMYKFNSTAVSALPRKRPLQDASLDSSLASYVPRDNPGPQFCINAQGNRHVEDQDRQKRSRMSLQYSTHPDAIQSTIHQQQRSSILGNNWIPPHSQSIDKHGDGFHHRTKGNSNTASAPLLNLSQLEALLYKVGGIVNPRRKSSSVETGHRDSNNRSRRYSTLLSPVNSEPYDMHQSVPDPVRKTRNGYSDSLLQPSGMGHGEQSRQPMAGFNPRFDIEPLHQDGDGPGSDNVDFFDAVQDASFTEDLMDLFLFREHATEPEGESSSMKFTQWHDIALDAGLEAMPSASLSPQMTGGMNSNSSDIEKQEHQFLLHLTKFLLDDSEFQHGIQNLAKHAQNGMPQYRSLLLLAQHHVERFIRTTNTPLEFVLRVLNPPDDSVSGATTPDRPPAGTDVLDEFSFSFGLDVNIPSDKNLPRKPPHANRFSSIDHGQGSTHEPGKYLDRMQIDQPVTAGATSGPSNTTALPSHVNSDQGQLTVPNISGKWKRTRESEKAMQKMRRECGVTWVLSKMFEFMESKFEIEQEGVVVCCRLNFVANTTLRFVLDGEEHPWGFRIPFFPSLTKGLTYRAWVDGNAIVVSHTILGQRLTRINWTSPDHLILHSTVILDEYKNERVGFVEVMRCDQQAVRYV